MDNKSKILFVVFFAAILISAGISFYKYYVLRDYYIVSEIDCDPSTESCFIYVCDPETDGEECPIEEADRISYYKILEKKAYDFPMCDPNSEDCDAYSCQADQDCSIILCDETAIEEGEKCSNPEGYNAAADAEEESEAEGNVPADEIEGSAVEESSVSGTEIQEDRPADNNSPLPEGGE